MPKKKEEHAQKKRWGGEINIALHLMEGTHFFRFQRTSIQGYKLNSRAVSVLVSTDVAAMGLDVMDLNLSVNIGTAK